MIKSNKKQLVGYVVESKMEKTVVVKVDRRNPHPKYKKYITQSKKYYAHDPKNECNSGDLVSIIECRPMSKLKRWRVGSIEKKAVLI